jgi:hypothetical protein
LIPCPALLYSFFSFFFGRFFFSSSSSISFLQQLLGLLPSSIFLLHLAQPSFFSLVSFHFFFCCSFSFLVLLLISFPALLVAAWRSSDVGAKHGREEACWAAEMARLD